jgi:hypothetical protein
VSAALVYVDHLADVRRLAPSIDPATVSPRAEAFSKADLEHVDAALLSVVELLKSVRPEERAAVRADLRQELSIKLWQKKINREGLRKSARNRLLDLFKVESRRKELDQESGHAPVPGRRRTELWRPTWYPPHPKATDRDWLACEGARVMHVKGATSCVNAIEAALVEYVDFSEKVTSEMAC